MPKLLPRIDLGKRIALDLPRGQRDRSGMETRPGLGVVLAAAVVLASPAAARAQAALTTDLWRVAAGTLVVPPALANDGSAALWTPATTLPGSGLAAHVGVETIHADADAGVSGAVATIAFRPSGTITVNFVYGRMSVGDLVRTETSPEALGGIPAFAQVVSLGVARSVAGGLLTVGAAARALTGQLDTQSRTRLAADVGAQCTTRHVRLGVATRFFDPTSNPRASGAAYSVAGEVRTSAVTVWGAPAVAQLRYGMGFAAGEGPAHLVSAGISLGGAFDLDVGAARESVAGAAVWRSRFGAALTAGRYHVYVGRDGGVNGFGPTYRFGVAAVVK